MSKGLAADIGATRISQNGYHYTKTPTGWILTHRLVIEKQLGRLLHPDERIRFLDGDRTNISVDNLEVRIVKQTKSKEALKAQIQSKIDDLQARLEELDNS